MGAPIAQAPKHSTQEDAGAAAKGSPAPAQLTKPGRCAASPSHGLPKIACAAAKGSCTPSDLLSKCAASPGHCSGKTVAKARETREHSFSRLLLGQNCSSGSRGKPCAPGSLSFFPFGLAKVGQTAAKRSHTPQHHDVVMSRCCVPWTWFRPGTPLPASIGARRPRIELLIVPLLSPVLWDSGISPATLSVDLV